MRAHAFAAILRSTSSEEETAMTKITKNGDAENSQRRAYWSQSRLFIVHVSGEETDGRLSVVEGLLPHDAMTPLHVLPRVDQILYVLEGELTAYLPGIERVLRSGDSMLQPAGAPQTHRVTSAEPARVLAINAPAGFERFFIETGRPAERLALPQPEAPPSDLGALAAIAVKHGIELLGPPGALPDEAAISGRARA
jgi:quercetin dioxygenase-like cupin family protein